MGWPTDLRPFQGISKSSHIVWFANISEICAMILHACFITAAATFYIHCLLPNQIQFGKSYNQILFERSINITKLHCTVNNSKIKDMLCSSCEAEKGV